MSLSKEQQEYLDARIPSEPKMTKEVKRIIFNRASGLDLEIQDCVKRMIEWIGDNPDREGLGETPERVVRSWGELFSGYRDNPKKLLKTFKDGTCDEMVLVKDLSFLSFCEHHMLPFQGVAHIAYLPNGRIVGLSKLGRLLDCFAKRLQVQERLTVQVTDALMKHLKPKGAACVIEASHMCFGCRGAKKPNAKMVTSSLTGPFKKDAKTRSEFFGLI